jgi:hypothetical protein
MTNWVIELRRVCLQRRKSVCRTAGSGCSFWPTPRVTSSGCVASRVQVAKALAGVLSEKKVCKIELSAALLMIRLSRLTCPTSTGGDESWQHDPDWLRLSPDFAEWLMGWPIGWTGSGVVEMGSFLCRQRSRICSLIDAYDKEA